MPPSVLRNLRVMQERGGTAYLVILFRYYPNPDEKAGAAVARIVEEKPEAELLSKVGRDRIAGLGCPHCGDFSIVAWGRANGMPRYRCKACRKDVHSVDGDALVRIALQGSLDRSGASLDLRRVHREGGGALRDRSHDGVPVASSISFRSQSRQAEVSIGNRRGGRDIHSGIFQGPA
jgi:hypothetical protein